ncbi:HlyD family type I secretion periplasmic adaptor subunit [Alphaproteobacteria bacterium LSUCC0684]
MRSDSGSSRSFIKRLFGFGRGADKAPEEETCADGIKVEKVEAEAVDPKAPLPRSVPEEDDAETPPPRLSIGGRIAAWFGRRKQAIVNFFIPRPVLVPAQLVTPEISLDSGSKAPLKGQMIYIIIAVFFVSAVSWAMLSEIDEVVRADGEVVPSENVQIIQSRLPGSVVAIHVKLGDRVSKGDVVFEVEDEDVRANFEDNEIQRLTASATIHRLEAESRGDGSIRFPAELLQEAPEVTAQEAAVFQSRRKALDSEKKVIEQEIESLRQGIAEQIAEGEVAAMQIATIKEELSVVKPLVDRGYEPKLSLLNVQARLDEAMGRERLAGLAAQRMEADLKSRQRRLQAVDDSFRADAETRLVEVRTEAAQAEARLEALKGKVAYAAVRAPADGVISVVHINTIGAVVDGGAIMAELVPDESEVTVRARVNTDDVSKIRIGQKVRISLTSYDPSRFGTLEGQVQKIASNSTQEENQPPYFVTMVNVPDTTFPQSGVSPDVVPGMTVIVDLLGDKRTIMEYILSPIKRAQTIAFREK